MSAHPFGRIVREREIDRLLRSEMYVEALQEMPARQLNLRAIVLDGLLCWLPLLGLIAFFVWVL